MDPKAINQAEWKKAENWSGPKWLSIYFSKKDSRLWVPKQIPAMGWTLNFAHPRAVYWLVACIIVPVMLVILINIFGASFLHK